MGLTRHIFFGARAHPHSPIMGALFKVKAALQASSHLRFLLPSPASNRQSILFGRRNHGAETILLVAITKSSVAKIPRFSISIMNSLFGAKRSRLDAIEKAQQLSTDWEKIILDLSMPELNGLEAAQLCRT